MIIIEVSLSIGDKEYCEQIEIQTSDMITLYTIIKLPEMFNRNFAHAMVVTLEHNKRSLILDKDYDAFEVLHKLILLARHMINTGRIRQRTVASDGNMSLEYFSP